MFAGSTDFEILTKNIFFFQKAMKETLDNKKIIKQL